ncbi:MAG: TonB-dependent receptor, partial [Planctomycetes bacterium]|nr:TonB-dependent receptor [Planctomycetota bacterium]
SRINDLVTRIPVQEAYSDQMLPQLYKNIQTTNPDIDIFVFDNVDEVQIQGIEVTATIPIHSGCSIYGNSTLTRGKVLLLNGKNPDPNKPWEQHIRREPPLNGVAGIRWIQSEKRFWGEFFVRSASKQDRLSHGDIRDPRIPGTTRDTSKIKFNADGQAVAQGTPGWVTLNLRGGIQISGYSQLTVSLENLLDKRYREHGTGVDAPGINVVVSINSQL